MDTESVSDTCPPITEYLADQKKVLSGRLLKHPELPFIAFWILQNHGRLLSPSQTRPFSTRQESSYNCHTTCWRIWKGHFQEDRQGIVSALNCLQESSVWSCSDTHTAQLKATGNQTGPMLCTLYYSALKALVFLLHTACCPLKCEQRQAQVPKQCSTLWWFLQKRWSLGLHVLKFFL